MTARVLVVDDLEPNVKLLEAKLRAEYFEVLGALSGHEAIKKAKEHQPDIILLDVMMPGIDGFETCRELKAAPETCHIPVIMVTALDQQADRVAGLEAGADDFLSKPVEDVALFARVRSLTRLKMMTDELRTRHATSAELGIVTNAKLAAFDSVESHILIIDDAEVLDESATEVLPPNYHLIFEKDAKEALSTLRSQRIDLIIVNMGMESYDPLRLCSTIRSIDETRLTPLLALVQKGDTRRLVRGLDIGVNDYLMRPIDLGEMNARMRTQVRRKFYIEELRSSFHKSLEMAITDQLTGLYNRRYLATHIDTMFEEAVETNQPLSALLIDIDHFKPINDTYGHDVGDDVLKQMSKRLLNSVRGIDLACRYGGEEFVFLMPCTEKSLALIIAERLREDIAKAPIKIILPNEVTINVTVSIGVSSTTDGAQDDTSQKLLKRADEALYKAKEDGRNRVVDAVA